VANNAVETRRVPKAALALNIGAMQFTAAREDGVVPVTVLARSAQPIQHWYWGAVVHDMAGFKPAAPSIPLDYCHDDEQIIGFLDAFEPGKDGLTCSGQVVPFGDDDRASEVIFKSAKGVPYQASIYFDPDELVIEQVPPGMSAQVNGYTQQGPATIIRQWKLRGVATCPYGYDVNTATRLSDGQLAGEIDLPISLTLQPTMDNTQSAENKPAEKPQSELATKPADPVAEFKATLAKFAAKFGPENGAKWAAEGLSYEAALEKHSEALATQLTAATDKKAELETKLAAVPRGEEKPASFSTTEKHEGGGSSTPAANQLSAVGKFAAELKMPK
jgi:hypothetical protein